MHLRMCSSMRPDTMRAHTLLFSCPSKNTLFSSPPAQTTPLIAGLTIGSAAYAAKLAIEAFAKYQAAPRLRAYYKVRNKARPWRKLSLPLSLSPPFAPLFCPIPHSTSLCPPSPSRI